MAWLVALDGGFSGKRFVLETTFLVGRGPFNHLVLDDSTISRQHAKIAPEGGGGRDLTPEGARPNPGPPRSSLKFVVTFAGL